MEFVYDPERLKWILTKKNFSNPEKLPFEFPETDSNGGKFTLSITKKGSDEKVGKLMIRPGGKITLVGDRGKLTSLKNYLEETFRVEVNFERPEKEVTNG